MRMLLRNFSLSFYAAATNSNFLASFSFDLQIYFLSSFGFYFGVANVKGRISASAADFAYLGHTITINN